MWAARWPKGERDHGIDDHCVIKRFVILPGLRDAPQRNNLSYKGQAVGLDLSIFTATRAWWRQRYGSTCSVTELACRGPASLRSWQAEC